MAADTVVLPVAVLAPVAVALGLETMAQSAPGVGVVLRHRRIVALHALIPLMADIAGLTLAVGLVHGEVR
ncbi:MAG: hypothetical protein A2X56_12725 [Nitrospirae bacterium GWC2_57_13]|nr:MAG: hypothetical protein A2X56_12725 [Nitrospirae bacterium GWC2_57_13]